MASGDNLAWLVAYGHDGTDYNSIAGTIQFTVDGTVAGNRVPGRIGFFTAAGSADDDYTERMTIKSNGNVGIGTTSPTSKLAVEQGADTELGGLILGANGDNDYRAAFMNTSGVLSFTGGDASTFNTATLSAAGVWTDAPSFSFLKEQRSILSRDEVLAILASTTIERFKLKSEVAQYGSAADLQLGIILDEAHPWLSNHDLGGNIIGYSPMRTASVAFAGVQMLTTVFDISTASTTLPALAIDANGNIGIGTSTPDYTLRVEGDIAARSFVNISTRAAKKDIITVDVHGEESLLDALLSATTTTYRYTNDPAGETHLGLIAEEAPIAIQSANGKGIDLYKMATALLAGIKAQERKIQELDDTIAKSGDTVPEGTNAWIVDQQSGRVNVLFYGDINMQGNSIVDVKKITGYLGKWSMDEEGTLMAVRVITNELIAQKVTIGSADQPSGITLYDEVTKDPYCVKIVSGAVVPQSGACGSVDDSRAPISNSHSSSSDSGINEAETMTIAASETATSTPETMTEVSVDEQSPEPAEASLPAEEETATTAETP
ncbi:MAG: tail fiber domain-containing protein [Candidatus Sungbacteria bacterium]|nr:tail fiber domain-containing protein [Candidatus Sungbacteria bacterium]